MTRPTLLQQIYPLDPAVEGISTEYNKNLCLHSAQQTGHRGMGQVEKLLQIPGAGRLIGMDQISNNMALRGGKSQIRQLTVDPLFQNEMQHLHLMP